MDHSQTKKLCDVLCRVLDSILNALLASFLECLVLLGPSLLLTQSVILKKWKLPQKMSVTQPMNRHFPGLGKTLKYTRQRVSDHGPQD
jgi:hypothetical protein